MVTRPKFIESFQVFSPFPLLLRSSHCSKPLPLLPYSSSPLFILFQPRVSRFDATPLYSRNKLPSARLWDHRPPSVLCFLVPWADNDDTASIKGWQIPLSPPLSNLAENKGDTRRRRRRRWRRRTMGEVERPRETVSNPESRNCSSHRRRLHIFNPAIFSPFS